MFVILKELFFFKNIPRRFFSTSETIYYPVVNTKLKCSHVYPSQYVLSPGFMDSLP